MPDASGYTTREAKQPDTRRPLFRPLLEPEPFPMEALGPLQKAAEAIQAKTQAPAAMCGQSVLAAASLVAMPHADVDLPTGAKPLACYFVTVAESGERKSSVDRLATRPIAEKEMAMRDTIEEERQSFAVELATWENTRDEAKKLAKKGKSAVREAHEANGPKPVPPPEAMLLMTEPTTQALEMHLANRPWAGVFTDEGGMFVGGHSMNDENRQKTGAFYNGIWDGSPIRRVRVTTGSLFLPGRRCAMHIMLQPVAAVRLLGDRLLDGLGTLARMLPVAPTSTAGTRLWKEPDDRDTIFYGDYLARMRRLLNAPPRLNGDALDPHKMPLSRDALALWKTFHDAIEIELGEGGGYRAIRGFGAKMPEHAARLAGVLAFYARGGEGQIPEISAEDMSNGIVLAQHYGSEMLRLAGGADVAAELREAQEVLEWLQGRNQPEFYLAEVYQNGPASVRSAKSARAAIDILLDHDWLRPLPPDAVLGGKTRKAAWRLVDE